MKRHTTRREVDFNISEINDDDRFSVTQFIADRWGSPLCVSKGKINDTGILPGFVCKENNEIIGLVTYHIANNECEIVTLDSRVEDRGLGTKLIECVLSKAGTENWRRVWLITTNDNSHAIRFYQKRGFEWIGFYKDAMQLSRQLKPQIPEYGNDGIPIKYEIEFEYQL